jgi:hypothetical protein
MSTSNQSKIDILKLNTPADILHSCAELLDKKGQDYNASGVSRDDYFPFGRMSYMQMIHIKYLRLRSLINQDGSNFESIDDTLQDLINYAAIWAAHERKSK